MLAHPEYRKYEEQNSELGVLSFHDLSACSHNPKGATHRKRQDGRVVVYESSAAPPRIVDVPFTNAADYIETLSTTVYELSLQQGGHLPYTIIRPLAENLIHADFSEPVISLADRGHTISFADQGGGIAHKNLSRIPGFSSADRATKEIIAGVGSGLPTVAHFAKQKGGRLEISDNLNGGTVITLSLPQELSTAPVTSTAPATSPHPQPTTAPTTIGDATTATTSAPKDATTTTTTATATTTVPTSPDTATTTPSAVAAAAPPYLSDRQKEVLALVANYGVCGPSRVSDLLGISLSTAFRDLEHLATHELLSTLPGGKRSATLQGVAYLDHYVFEGTRATI
jgi:hypothetical protein